MGMTDQLLPALLKPRAADPMEQFEIVEIFPLSFNDGVSLAFTNSSLFMMFIVLSALLFFTLATQRLQLIPTGIQSMGEVAYEFIAKMVHDTMGEEGRQFFPFVFTLFTFVFLANFLGLLPTIPGAPHAIHSFTVTSHIVVTFVLALMSIGMVVVFGVAKHGFGFLNVFLPSGIPLWLAPLIVLIEIISFMSRPLSLGVRLFMNMLVGHVLLKVFAGFVAGLIMAGGIVTGLALIPMFAIVFIYLLEFLVAFLQAFVFAMLTCIYLQDALHPKH